MTTMKRSQNQIKWRHVVVFVVVVIGLPALFNRGAKDTKWSFQTSSAARETFDDSRLQEIQAKKPDFVFIGNSMLESRIEPTVLDSLVPGKKSYILSRHGSGSTVWYLLFKYSLIGSGVIPEKVFIFFRDAELTNPDVEELCTWAMKQWVNLLPCDDEPFDRIFSGEALGWKQRAARLTKQAYPVRNKQEQVNIFLRRLSSRWWVSAPEDMSYDEAMDYRFRETWKIQHKVNDLFVMGNLRSQNNDAVFDPNTDPRFYDFGARLHRSFLPEMVSLAKDNGIELWFIRTKRRPDDKTGITYQNEEIITYIQDLREYLAEEGCHFYDFTDDPELDIAWYAGEDHVKWDLRDLYTKKFFKDIPEAFQ